MTTILYPAFADTNPAGGYSATFPDLPGCVAHGANMGDLLTDARQKLTEALKVLTGNGEGWPTPSSMEHISPGARAGAVLLVDIEVDDPPTRVNISIGERLLKRIDTAAQVGGMTRSGFIAQAARTALGDAPGKSDRTVFEFEAAARRLQDELVSVGRKLNDSLGPDSAFSRGMADLDHRVFDRIQKTADSVSAAMAKRKQGHAASPSEDARV